MTAMEVLRDVREEHTVEDVARHWDDSMADMPKGTLPLLEPRRISEDLAWCGFEPVVARHICAVAHQIAETPALRQLAWHCYWRVFKAPEPVTLGNWPTLENVLGQDAAMFYLLVGLGMVPLTREFHRSLGLPQDVAQETCQQVRCYCEAYVMGTNGRLGMHIRPLPWLRHYTREPYFRLGRLEYWFKPNPASPVVYRHRRTRDVVALAEDGIRFTADGYIRSDLKPEDDPGGWTSRHTLTESFVTGHPVSPFGMALASTVTLPLDEWTCVLKRGDPILQIHIPSGGNLTPDAQHDTIRRAVEFFRQYLPDKRPVAIASGSWIFNNQLEEFMPPEANLVRFLKELYLYPIPSTPQSGLWFIFLQDNVHPRTAPRRTSLQRQVCDYLAEGHAWRVGGMFVLADDVPRFGSQYYRSKWPPAVLRK